MNPRRVVLVAMMTLPFVRPPGASATVYSWTSETGVLMMSNDPGDVPPEQQASARQFTSKPAPKPAQDVAADDPPSTPPAAAFDACERGLDAGLQVAERQVALAEQLARIQTSAPQPPAAPIIIEQSPPPQPAAYYPQSPYGSPYYGYGFGAPYAPYFFPPTFAVSVAPNRHHFFGGFLPHRFGSSPFPGGRFATVSMTRMR